MDTRCVFGQHFAPKGGDKTCTTLTKLACNRAIESSCWRAEQQPGCWISGGLCACRSPAELELMGLGAFPDDPGLHAFSAHKLKDKTQQLRRRFASSNGCTVQLYRCALRAQRSLAASRLSAQQLVQPALARRKKLVGCAKESTKDLKSPRKFTFINHAASGAARRQRRRRSKAVAGCEKAGARGLPGLSRLRPPQDFKPHHAQLH